MHTLTLFLPMVCSVVVGFVQFSEWTGSEGWGHSPAQVSTSRTALNLIVEWTVFIAHESGLI